MGGDNGKVPKFLL